MVLGSPETANGAASGAPSAMMPCTSSESRFALGRPEEEEQEEQEEEMVDDSSAVEPALVLDPDRLKEVRDVQCRE